MTKSPILLLLAVGLLLALPFTRAATPQVGDQAPNFSLLTLDERTIELDALTQKSRVLLVVLRGWPGYQCPICARQVKDLVSHAGAFNAEGVQVLMVYPGPAPQLQAHAQEFLADKTWPANFLLVLDPAFTFTNAYGLRWDAKNETAYPATFIIGPHRMVSFAHVSTSHGDRINTEQALAALRGADPGK